jgi:hypothetical protein
MTTNPENPAQADIDADTTEINADLAELANFQVQVAALVASAQAANTPVDTSALDALVQQADATAQSYATITTPPTPTP